jgi:hypothetical protein
MAGRYLVLLLSFFLYLLPGRRMEDCSSPDNEDRDHTLSIAEHKPGYNLAPKSVRR